MVDQKQTAVVGKNVSAPRPDSASGTTVPSAAPTQQTASREGVEGNPGAPGEPTTEEEPELSWRGTRQGQPWALLWDLQKLTEDGGISLAAHAQKRLHAQVRLPTL